jgi:hypothetical protein
MPAATIAPSASAPAHLLPDNHRADNQPLKSSRMGNRQRRYRLQSVCRHTWLNSPSIFSEA